MLETALGVVEDYEFDGSAPKQGAVPFAEFGDYHLLEEIGRGGQGVVYRARQKSLNRTVALKVIGLGHWASTPHLKRFRSEAEAAAKLEHPRIVPIYEIGERDGSCYFSMKFIEGGRLDEVLAREPMPVRRAAELIVKIARTVQFAHEHAILHRDIKPGNILLDRDGEPHLTDFGLARLTEQESTVTNSDDVLGTPSYMSPEQAAGRAKELTASADVYSLGAVFYHLLTGQPPFAGPTPYETARLVLQTEPRSPRLLNHEVDRDLSTICLKSLEKEPAKRYATAGALADDAERWLRHEPIRARRSGPFTRGTKWLRRNPTTAVAAISLAALLAIGVVAFWRSYTGDVQPANGIAVLPFENLSGDPSNAYFADVIQAEILTRLARISDLKVISRTSTQNYKSRPGNLSDIAKQLGVAHVLEGSVQRTGDSIRVNVELLKAGTDSHLWAESFDGKLNDILSVESEITIAVADQLRAKLTGQQQQVIAAKPTDNPEAYDAYLRGLAYTLRAIYIPANALAAQKYLKQAVRLDPKFALCWALLSYVDARGYLTRNLQPTVELREEARQAAETAFNLQPKLGEAALAIGYYHYACLKDYDTAERYYEVARQLLPNNSQVPELLAYAARRRGRWGESQSYFDQAERLDPRNVYLLTQHAQSYILLRRFPEALRKLDEVLNIVPDDLDTLAIMAAVAQAQGDLPRAAALLGPLHLTADDPNALETRIYQSILERRPASSISLLKELLAKPNPDLGYYNSELRFCLGWLQTVAGDQEGAQETLRQARRELQSYLEQQPDNNSVLENLALTNALLGDKAAAFAVVDRATKAIPLEKDAMTGPRELEVLARVAALTGEHDRAIVALRQLLTTPYSGAIVEGVPVTPAFLRLDPMFDSLRDKPAFQELVAERPHL